MPIGRVQGRRPNANARQASTDSTPPWTAPKRPAGIRNSGRSTQTVPLPWSLRVGLPDGYAGRWDRHLAGSRSDDTEPPPWFWHEKQLARSTVEKPARIGSRCRDPDRGGARIPNGCECRARRIGCRHPPSHAERQCHRHAQLGRICRQNRPLHECFPRLGSSPRSSAAGTTSMSPHSGSDSMEARAETTRWSRRGPKRSASSASSRCTQRGMRCIPLPSRRIRTQSPRVITCTRR